MGAKADDVVKWTAIAGFALFVAYKLLEPSSAPTGAVATEGRLAEKTLGCIDAATLEAAQERLNTNNDWMPAAGLVLKGKCYIFDPGDAWRMIERGSRSTLVYVTKGSVPHRVYVPTSKLRS